MCHYTLATPDCQCVEIVQLSSKAARLINLQSGRLDCSAIGTCVTSNVFPSSGITPFYILYIFTPESSALCSCSVSPCTICMREHMHSCAYAWSWLWLSQRGEADIAGLQFWHFSDVLTGLLQPLLGEYSTSRTEWQPLKSNLVDGQWLADCWLYNTCLCTTPNQFWHQSAPGVIQHFASSSIAFGEKGAADRKHLNAWHKATPGESQSL